MNVNFTGRYAVSGFGKPKPESHLYPGKPGQTLQASLDKLQEAAAKSDLPMTVLAFEQCALAFTEQDAAAPDVAKAIELRQAYEDAGKQVDVPASQVWQLDNKERALNAKVAFAQRDDFFLIPGVKFFEGKGFGAYLKAKLRHNPLSRAVLGPVKLSAEDVRKRTEAEHQLAQAAEVRNQAYDKLSAQISTLAQPIVEGDWLTPGTELNTELKHGLRDLATGRLKKPAR